MRRLRYFCSREPAGARAAWPSHSICRPWPDRYGQSTAAALIAALDAVAGCPLTRLRHHLPPLAEMAGNASCEWSGSLAAAADQRAAPARANDWPTLKPRPLELNDLK